MRNITKGIFAAAFAMVASAASAQSADINVSATVNTTCQFLTTSVDITLNSPGDTGLSKFVDAPATGAGVLQIECPNNTGALFATAGQNNYANPYSAPMTLSNGGLGAFDATVTVTALNNGLGVGVPVDIDVAVSSPYINWNGQPAGLYTGVHSIDIKSTLD